MIYSYSYFISKEVPEHIRDEYKNRSDIQGMHSIANMISRDFKYHEYNIGYRNEKPKYTIELAVFDRQQWYDFIKNLRMALPQEYSEMLMQKIKELENKKTKDTDNNRM